MNLALNPTSVARSGRVASLHVHAAKSGEPLASVEIIHVMADKGIVEDTRYFSRRSRATGQPSRRQISLIEREQIAEHAATLGLNTIAPGVVRANIETIGINLQELVGRQIVIGEAVLFIYEPRDPCHKMDLICPGLRELMENNRQGVLAQVLGSGAIRVGDPIGLHAAPR